MTRSARSTRRWAKRSRGKAHRFGGRRCQPEDPVILGHRRSAAVAVAREDIERPVRTFHDRPQPAVALLEQRLVHDELLAVEAHVTQLLPDEVREQVVPVQALPACVTKVAPEGAMARLYTRSGASNPVCTEPTTAGQP